MDNSIIVFKKDQHNKFEKTVTLLLKALTIERKGELIWFLELAVIRNHSKKALWLLQKAYILKICNNLTPGIITSRLPDMGIEILEILAAPNNKDIMNVSQTLYQQKVKSLLFVAIATWPDIAFAVSRLSQFYQRPGKQHQKATDQVFYYLFQMRDYCIYYKGDAQDLSSIVYASNTSFDNHTLN